MQNGLIASHFQHKLVSYGDDEQGISLHNLITIISLHSYIFPLGPGEVPSSQCGLRSCGSIEESVIRV